MKNEFWAKADRAKRMKQAHQDLIKSGTSKIHFGQFEKKMLQKDTAQKKVEYEKRRIQL